MMDRKPLSKTGEIEFVSNLIEETSRTNYLVSIILIYT